MDDLFDGRYKLLNKIGIGGLSTVYAAVDTVSGRKVAIKLAKLPDDAASHDSFVQLFLQQVSVLSRLEHGSSVRIFDQGRAADGSPYFVMEFIEGTRLSDILMDRARLSVSEAISVAAQVAGALGAAHALGFIHRDVKPANILVLPDHGFGVMDVKLLDFGVAAQLETNTGLTKAGGFFGSVSYMSPEQLEGKPLSPSSDIWQLGVTLYEMLAGVLPFTSETTVGTMTAIINAKPEFPAGLSLPSPLVEFTLRCLTHDPKLRPGDGGEARAMLLNMDLRPDAKHGPYSAPAPVRASAPAVSSTNAMLPALSALKEKPAPYTLSIVLGCALLGFGLLAVLARLRADHPGVHWIGLLAGIGLVVGGIAFGRALAKVLAAKRQGLSAEAHQMLAGARGRDHLSETLAIQVDMIAARCRLEDEKFLAMTMAIMVDEYGAATSIDDRQKSLMNAVTILEKLTAKLTPWYVRQEKLIALCVTLVGLCTGLVTIVQSVMKFWKKG